MISGFIAVCSFVKAILSLRRELDSKGVSYMTRDRALIWRFKFEKIFRALESGNGNFELLPRPIKWLFKSVKSDNQIGKFGQWFLKSEKLQTGDKALEQPLYQTH